MVTEIIILNSQQLVFSAKLSFPAVSSPLVPIPVLPNPDVPLHLCSLGLSTQERRDAQAQGESRVQSSQPSSLVLWGSTQTATKETHFEDKWQNFL